MEAGAFSFKGGRAPRPERSHATLPPVKSLSISTSAPLLSLAVRGTVRSTYKRLPSGTMEEPHGVAMARRDFCLSFRRTRVTVTGSVSRRLHPLSRRQPGGAASWPWGRRCAASPRRRTEVSPRPYHGRSAVTRQRGSAAARGREGFFNSGLGLFSRRRVRRWPRRWPKCVSGNERNGHEGEGRDGSATHGARLASARSAHRHARRGSRGAG